ncbi:hypothetical protein A3D70_02700 [Candidatus Adlerbacteria bacterium RIFCSPHIGHO2_02_FULL_54_18]|uniref:Uncharacterized protein n=2 Tax=Candidatus Adleribacteriota TaxID=1752736 RepID=A0A1F4Y2N7_9BACT|nr:MAG: hypothetical protein A2949_01765 [Candidatus Adlerbacteria bacterium RIFCSPLOWO2_01_FULL_54_21b]OGC88237.1 MAG: hypothetical protein A3D70_02700 [Candidatus Adlerbacteria bacterium RIFCSPHIGHO2_02_FULL_54_18]
MATAIEYGLIAAGISVAIIAVVGGISPTRSYTKYDKPRIVELEPDGVNMMRKGEMKAVVVDWTKRSYRSFFFSLNEKPPKVDRGTEFVTSCYSPKIERVERDYDYPASINMDYSAPGGYKISC